MPCKTQDKAYHLSDHLRTT